jgi:long-chain acyl-CoA synthetase
VSHVPGVTRGISGLPLSHSFGLMVSVGGMHLPEPTTAVLLRWFDPTTWLRLAAEHRSQTAAMVPSTIAMLLACPVEEYDLSELRYIYSGASPLPPAVRAEFTRRVPGCAILEGYGCTETAGIATTNPPAAPRDGTVGRPVPGVRVRVVDRAGADVPAGDEGEVLIAGPNVMARYWDTPDPQGEWFATGDVGRLDGEGYLTIVDRMKDLIIRGGYNVYPRDIEDVLTSHPQVAMAGVVGRHDDRLGEEVVAFVSLVPGASVSPDELIAYARANLAAHKYPREVRVVDAIPLTSVLKVDRKRLRASL